MNRKQQAAITSGAVVIVLLVLFPPWTCMVPRVDLSQWKRPPEFVEVGIGHHPRFASKERRKGWSASANARLKHQREGEDKVYIYSPGPAAEIDELHGALLIAAALAVTVAAVLLLRSRTTKTSATAPPRRVPEKGRAGRA